MQNQVLIGADPEVFVQEVVIEKISARSRWTPVPAFGRFGGSKDKPIAMTDMEEGFAYLEDNAALEFNIPPQKDRKGFVDAINAAKGWLVGSVLQKQNLEFTDLNCLDLLAKFQRDPRSQEVGCSADYDAYENEGAPRAPFDGSKLGATRYAGGHIHLSYNHSVVPPFVAARFLDLYLSLPFMEYDRQGLRRGTYGKAGLFRPKSYGVEYRTPSNWWLWHGDRAMQSFADKALVFARKTYDPAYLDRMSEAYLHFPWHDVQRCVANEDAATGARLLDLANTRFGLEIPIGRV